MTVSNDMPPGGEKPCSRVAISVDMDPIGHYLRCRGFEPLEYTNLNAVYDDALPRFLDLFENLNVKATFFVVGEDAAHQCNADILRHAHSLGHELANHTMTHRLDMDVLGEQECEKEIACAEDALEAITGQRPAGFRAPGWNISNTLFDILEKRGYVYDSSVLPGPWFSLIKRLKPKQTQRVFKGQKMFPPAPDKPYRPSHANAHRAGARRLLEIPCAVSPGLRLPLYGTAIMMLGSTYFRFAVNTIPTRESYPAYVFHGLELVDYHEHINDSRLKVKPGITWPVQKKISVVRDTIRALQSHFHADTLDTFESLARDFTA